ncbi:MAG TPA: bifunctional oligoribonuclease/PAP phosphatase NrnA [Gaiellaceae bacterium]|nr:bifunctional oligoribonuclease/PAP phosphatase NrnA [Gaiellaceae bacterium]
MTNPELKAVADAIRGHDRFLVTTHENPDGDALGSLLGITLGLRDLGKDAVMFLSGDVPLPAEYRFMPLDDVLRGLPPPDTADRIVLAVDCANDSRLGAAAGTLLKAPLVMNVDHHHDNTRFGQINCVVADASSTGEIMRDLLGELGVALTAEIAEPLYVAVVTDTGRFMYSNTTPRAHRVAAELIEAGVDVQRVFRAVYESVQFPKLKLLARALERAQLYDGGRIVVSWLRAADFAEVGAEEPFSEGIIDFLRAVEGSELAVLIREPPRSRPDAPRHRISLRSNVDGLDVSAIARASGKGGGHVRAAGFSSEDSMAEITDFIRREYAAASSQVA